MKTLSPENISAQAIEKKLRLSGELLEFALELKKSRLKDLNPSWTEDKCLKEAVKLIQDRDE